SFAALPFPPSTSHFYTLSLHDALPIYVHSGSANVGFSATSPAGRPTTKRHRASGTPRFKPRSHKPNWRIVNGLAPITISPSTAPDRKSTRLNSSHVSISYAVFCLKKKK